MQNVIQLKLHKHHTDPEATRLRDIRDLDLRDAQRLGQVFTRLRILGHLSQVRHPPNPFQVQSGGVLESKRSNVLEKNTSPKPNRGARHPGTQRGVPRWPGSPDVMLLSKDSSAFGYQVLFSVGHHSWMMLPAVLQSSWSCESLSRESRRHSFSSACPETCPELTNSSVLGHGLFL